MKADETYVLNGLTPYLNRIRQVAERGYGDWLKSSDRSKFLFERTRANARYDHIARHAIAEFSNEKGVRIIAEYESVKLLFCKGTIVVRYKHADEDGLSSNIETQTALAFIDPERTIPGLLPDVHKVECCFRQNDIDTALNSVTMTARDMGKKIWAFELLKTESTAEVISLVPRTPPADTPPEVRPRQTQKDSEKESQKD